MRTIDFTRGRILLASVAAACTMTLAAQAGGAEAVEPAPSAGSGPAATYTGDAAPRAAADQPRKECRRVVLSDGRVVYRCRWVIRAAPAEPVARI